MVKKKTQKRKRKPQIVTCIIVAILIFIFAYPMWYTLVVSLSDVEYAYESGFKFWPPTISWAAYKEVFSSNRIFIGFFNTVWRTVVGTLLTLVLTFCGAYAMRYKHIRGYALINFIIVFTMYFSGGVVPTYINMKELGLINSRWVFVLPGAVSAYNLLVMRSFLSSMGMELDEAARIDGANPFQIMMRIYLPLSKAILAVIGLWSAVGHWNSYYDGMIYAPKSELLLLQNYIRMLTGDMYGAAATGDVATLADVTPLSVQSATIMIATIPILIVYPFVQKHLVKGTMIGALKG